MKPLLSRRFRQSGRKVLRGAKRRLRRLNRRRPAPAPQPRPRQKPPLLSVVLVVHNDESYLTECIESLLGQSLQRLEVIAVDNGSTDGSAGLLERLAAKRSRLKVINAERRPSGAARDLGVARARGTYVCFVNPQDTVPLDAYRVLVRSLQRTGSDFAVGAVEQIRNGRRTFPAWSRLVHEVDRPNNAIDEFPTAMLDLHLYNRVFRRIFWIKAVGGFGETGEFGELLPIITAYLRAHSFDVLRTVTYSWQMRSDHASLVHERYDHALLSQRLPVLQAAWELVSDHPAPAVSAAWLGGMLDTDLGTYLEQANAGDDAYRTLLQATAREFFDLTTPEAWQHVRVDRRLRVWLAVQGRWSVLEQCVEYFRLNGPIPPTRLVGDRVVAVVPFRDALGADLPQVCLELSTVQTSLAACVQKAAWNDQGQLVVEGWAYIRGVDLSDLTPTLEAALVEPVSGQRLPVPLEPLRIPAASRWENQAYQNVDAAGFRLTLDVSGLEVVDPAEGPRRWHLQLTNQTGDLERSGGVRSVIRSGIGLRVRARELQSVDDAVRYVPVVDLNLGFAVQVRPDRVRATDLDSRARGEVKGTLAIVNPIAVPLVGVRATSDGVRVEAPITRAPDGSLRFELTLPTGGEARRRWNFRALGEDGRRYRVSWPDEVSAGDRVVADDLSVVWLRSPRGFADLVTDVVSMQAVDVVVTDALITVDVATLGLQRAHLEQVRLRSPVAEIGPTVVSALGPDRYRLQFPTRTEIWGTPDLPLPPGTYRVVVDSQELECGVSDSFLERCPQYGLTESHGYTIARSSGRDRLTVALRGPLPDDERGRFANRRLSAWYDGCEFEPRDAVLFQCYRGEFSTDSQRALHEELYRRGSPLTLLWGVASLSVPLPEGAVPLLIGSGEWFEAVGSARYLCQNIDFDRFFRKRPYQSYLQTFHGYPWKSMGVSLWRAQGKSESLIALECERRTEAWDSIVVPAPFCEELYRREYRYPHEVLVTGYPRDDVLVTADAAAVRATVLERLGIGPEQTVVLYAPTWRDSVATSAWTAPMFDELDLDRLREQLGDDYTVLLRGHNYNLRGGDMQASASVLDVSSYPEINDLILAADVAILDYSSLRFDWMLTNKPVLFFVPDLANYLSARTVLFEYAPTAPGPLLTTTDEVVAALHDLPHITDEYAPDREVFNREYQSLHDGHATARVVERFFGAAAGSDRPRTGPVTLASTDEGNRGRSTTDRD